MGNPSGGEDFSFFFSFFPRVFEIPRQKKVRKKTSFSDTASTPLSFLKKSITFFLKKSSSLHTAGETLLSACQLVNPAKEGVEKSWIIVCKSRELESLYAMRRGAARRGAVSMIQAVTEPGSKHLTSQVL